LPEYFRLLPLHSTYYFAEKDNAVAKYALEGLPNKVLATEYKLTLPDEKLLAKEVEKTRKLLEKRKAGNKK